MSYNNLIKQCREKAWKSLAEDAENTGTSMTGTSESYCHSYWCLTVWFIQLHFVTCLLLTLCSNVQRNWRRCEILRGKRIPLLLFPVLTTWSWPNCYWTSESYKTPCRNRSSHLIVLMAFVVIKQLLKMFPCHLCMLPLRDVLCVSVARLTTSPKQMRSARWWKTSGTHELPNSASLLTASSVSRRLMPR